jgi:methionyl-tRNA synthetase
MMNNYWGGLGSALLPGIVAGWMSVLLVPLTLWSLFWMGWALWKSARNDSKIWFLILLLVHTMGILDIIYIFLVSKKQVKSSKKSR